MSAMVDSIIDVLDVQREERIRLQRNYQALMAEKRREEGVLRRRVGELEAKAGLRKHPKEIETVPIKRFKSGEVTYEEYLRFAARSEPFIVENDTSNPEGAAMVTPGVPEWTLEKIKSTCAGHQFMLKKESKEAVSKWARLVPIGMCAIEDYIDAILNVNAGSRSEADNKLLASAYLHDVSLVNECAELLDDLVIPKFFVPDITQKTPETLHYSYPRNYWPSLFIGPGASTSSALHADVLDTAAWMGVVQGKKHWRIVPPADRDFLYEFHETTNVFPTDLFVLDKEKYPLMTLSTIYDAVLQAGDVLFIPAASAHQVRNLRGEPTVAVAMNYVDESNLPMFLDKSREMAHTDGDAFYRYLNSVADAFEQAAASMGTYEGVEPPNMTFGDYKQGWTYPRGSDNTM